MIFFFSKVILALTDVRIPFKERMPVNCVV